MIRSIHEDGEFSASYIPHFTNPEEFVDAKIEMLRKEFRINLTDEDIAYLRSFKAEHEINAAVKGIINKYWE